MNDEERRVFPQREEGVLHKIPFRTRGWRYFVLFYAVMLVMCLLSYFDINVPPESGMIAIFVGWGALAFRSLHSASKEG